VALINAPIGNPYPSINAIMNVARARLNDTANSIDGDLLTNDAPAAQTYLTMAFHWYQEMCAAAGVETLIKSTVLSGFPARATQDVADEAWITWEGCSDGVNQYESLVLPQDMIQPLSIWRRPSGTINTFGTPMKLADDGLPTWFDCHVFDWRQDGIYLYAEQYAQDFRLRYSAYQPELDIAQPNSLVPMMRCENQMGARVAFEFCSALSGSSNPDTLALSALADKEFETGASSRTVRRKQRMNLRRQPYNRRRGGNLYPYAVNP
jgi:hypothetical protein